MTTRTVEVPFNKNAKLTAKQKRLCKDYVRSFLMLHNWKTYEQWCEENPKEVERIRQCGKEPKEIYDVTLNELVKNIMFIKNLLRNSGKEMEEINIKWREV